MVTTTASHSAWLALRDAPGVGRVTLARVAHRLLTQDLGGASLIGVSADRLRELGVSTRPAEAAAALLADPPPPPGLPRGVDLLTPDDPEYPSDLLTFAPALPVVLYVAGNMALLGQTSVAIAGSRRTAQWLLAASFELASACSSAGWNVVSGNARGVDSAAHAGAVRAGGTTTVVAASGLGHLKLDQTISQALDDCALVVTEFDPDAQWLPRRAMQRNATIAALSQAVVVVAAGESGGSKAQGDLSLKSNKPLFVADVDPETAPGNVELIAEGATAFDPNDPDQLIAEIGNALSNAVATTQASLFD